MPAPSRSRIATAAAAAALAVPVSAVLGPVALGPVALGPVALGPVPLLGSAAAAPARACAAPALKTATREARAVFVGTVESATTRPLPGRGTLVTHTVRVSGVWKGGSRITSSEVEVLTRSGTGEGCPLGRLPDGARFVFFASRAGGAWSVARDDGTTAARSDVVASLDRIYGDAKPPVAPAPKPATFTAVDTDRPLTTGRAAAPGAAMVLLGLLGLVVVRRVNRG